MQKKREVVESDIHVQESTLLGKPINHSSFYGMLNIPTTSFSKS